MLKTVAVVRQTNSKSILDADDFDGVARLCNSALDFSRSHCAFARDGHHLNSGQRRIQLAWTQKGLGRKLKQELNQAALSTPMRKGLSTSLPRYQLILGC